MTNKQQLQHTLLLLLAGPMQSWGSRSRFEDRDTHPEPTKSAVVGLLCAALGRGRGESLDPFETLAMGVRTEQPGRPMSDYQTAQTVLTADGNIKGTVLSRRHYLADARFLVGLQSADLDWLRELEAALQNPTWTLSLGRKSYPLVLPPYLPAALGGSVREGSELGVALRREPWRRVCRGEVMPSSLRLLLEGGEDIFADQPLHFGERRFGLRRVSIGVIKGDERPREENHPCICLS